MALRVVDWIWLPLLATGFTLVAVHVYAVGLLAIEAGGGIAFVVSQALRVRLAFTARRGWVSVRDDPTAPPPPGVRAERERRQRHGECPLTRSDQHWVELELVALASNLRIDRTDHPVIIPRQSFYPMDYGLTNTLVVDELTRKLCGIMKLDFAHVNVRLVQTTSRRTRDAIPDEPYAGHFDDKAYDAGPRRYVIELDPELASNPPLLTAVIAHELAHVRLHGYRDRISAGRHEEQRVDLLVIAYGLGLFGGNVRFKQHPALPDTSATSLGGLSQQTYAYALACIAWMRGDHAPEWVGTLDSPVRNELKRSLRYLAEHAGGGGLPTITTMRV